MGINQLIIRIFAFIPAPIVFGYIIDAACRLHQEDPCDPQAERNCLEYDADLFRLVCVCMCGQCSPYQAVITGKIYVLKQRL